MKIIYFFSVILMVLLGTNSVFAELVWVPSEYANAKKGDIMLQGYPNNFIGKLLAIFGGYWSHSGMMVDDYNTIRHNTMSIDEMQSLDMYYRIHAYINEDIQDWLDQFSNARVAGKGSHCSGTVWYANYLQGKQMNLFYASPLIVDAGA